MSSSGIIWHAKKRKIEPEYVSRIITDCRNTPGRSFRKTFIGSCSEPEIVKFLITMKNNSLRNLSYKMYLYRRSDRFRGIKTYRDLCKTLFVNRNYKCLANFIGKKWKKKALENLLEPLLVENEELPKLASRIIEFFVNKLLKKSMMDWDKRKVEREHISESTERLFVELCDVVIPEDVALYIFQYIPKNRRILDSVGVVSEEFYLLLLKSWKKIKVHKENLFRIPVLVLQSVKDIVFHTPKFFKSEFVYFHDNAKSYTKLYVSNGIDKLNSNFTFTRKERNKIGVSKEKAFFQYQETVSLNCRYLKIKNFGGCVVKRELFPNLREMYIGNTLNDTHKTNKDLFKSITVLKLGNLKGNWREGKRSYGLPKFVDCFQNLKRLLLNIPRFRRFSEQECVITISPYGLANGISSLQKLEYLSISMLGIFSVDDSKALRDVVKESMKLPLLNSLRLRCHHGAFENVLGFSVQVKETLDIINQMVNVRKVQIAYREEKWVGDGQWCKIVNGKIDRLRARLKSFEMKKEESGPDFQKFNSTFLVGGGEIFTINRDRIIPLVFYRLTDGSVVL